VRPAVVVVIGAPYCYLGAGGSPFPGFWQLGIFKNMLTPVVRDQISAAAVFRFALRVFGSCLCRIGADPVKSITSGIEFSTNQNNVEILRLVCSTLSSLLLSQKQQTESGLPSLKPGDVAVSLETHEDGQAFQFFLMPSITLHLMSWQSAAASTSSPSVEDAIFVDGHVRADAMLNPSSVFPIREEPRQHVPFFFGFDRLVDFSHEKTSLAARESIAQSLVARALVAGRQRASSSSSVGDGSGDQGVVRLAVSDPSIVVELSPIARVAAAAADASGSNRAGRVLWNVAVLRIAETDASDRVVLWQQRLSYFA
jgi:hypothetical protein